VRRPLDSTAGGTWQLANGHALFAMSISARGHNSITITLSKTTSTKLLGLSELSRILWLRCDTPLILLPRDFTAVAAIMPLALRES